MQMHKIHFGHQFYTEISRPEKNLFLNKTLQQAAPLQALQYNIFKLFINQTKPLSERGEELFAVFDVGANGNKFFHNHQPLIYG